MKKIVLILLLTSLFLFDYLKLYSDDCKFESPNCDWNGPYIREFSPNPPPLMCALCTLEVEYYWRRCPIGGGLQEEIKLTAIRHKTPLECSYCNKNFFKESIIELFTSGILPFTPWSGEGCRDYYRATAASCWKTITVFIPGWPPIIPDRTEIWSVPCGSNDACCRTQVTICKNSLGQITQVYSSSLLEVEDNCDDPCYIICDKLVFEAPIYYKTPDMSANNDFLEKGIEIIPNPNTGMFKILLHFKINDDLNIQIFNNFGLQVGETKMKAESDDGEIYFNVQNLH
ncbi:MAG: hypothetical protein N2319_06280 [Candidatus Kapabacteria bacterium]|nr:hypothetical protein [Candidatus Kapabacteria bacterium]